jgi:hypothetical protein
MLDDLEDPNDLRASLADARAGATKTRDEGDLSPWNEDFAIADEAANEPTSATNAAATNGTGAAGAPRERVVPTEAREWISPGVSARKRWLTGIGVALAAVVFFWLALHEGANMLVSTLIGVIFIGGFIGYLRVVAPTPYTLQLDAHGVTRADRGAEPIEIAWENIAKVKEEVFRSGVSVSVTVYKKVGARGLHRAYVVYRDDIPQFDAFVEALSAALPLDRPWARETVHG